MSRPHELSPETPAALSARPAGSNGGDPAATLLVAVSATFTAEPVGETLAFWTREFGWNSRMRFAPFNQVFQQLLDPGSLLAGNRGGFNIVLARLEDWARSGLETLEENVRHAISSVSRAAESFRVPVLVAVCPPSPGVLAEAASAALERRMEDLLRSAFERLPAVHLLLPAEVAELYPVSDYYDPHGDELGHVPYTPAYYAALGTALARKMHSLRRAPYKVIVLDCDETLWRGVCGEDGPQGVRLDAGCRALQEFMARQHDQGALLCLCSKNNEEDVLETFRLNPSMPLRMEHFVARRINWEPKAANLAALAAELNLALSSFIFVDDNPTECAEVQAHCPEVLTLPLPPQPEEVGRFLKHVWAFDRPRATVEDRNRTALYTQEIERGKLAKKAATLEAFLAALGLEVRIAPATRDQIPRIAQLSQRTSQMNVAPERRTESDIQALLVLPDAECLAVDVSDRFGSYGLVGVLLFRTAGEVLAVDTFLLSCRALGRGVEHRMLRRLGEIAVERGLGTVEIPYVSTARNSPARILLENVDSAYAVPSECGSLFRFPAGHLAGLEYRPAGAPIPAAAPAVSAPGSQPISESSLDFVRIATELCDVASVMACASSTPEPPERAAPPATPRTELERKLAAIWAEALGVPTIGVHDNFFDMGGHSLLAVQLLSRVRREMNVNLSLELVYGGPFTVAEMAKAIDLEQIGQAESGEYAELLKELEGLSDEEVRALLEAEQDGGSSPGAK